MNTSSAKAHRIHLPHLPKSQVLTAALRPVTNTFSPSALINLTRKTCKLCGMEGLSLETKLPIPKLRGINYSGGPLRNKRDGPRVQRACNNCRRRKIKCSGERPHCQSCMAQQMTCMYSQARRDRLTRSVSQRQESPR